MTELPEYQLEQLAKGRRYDALVAALRALQKEWEQTKDFSGEGWAGLASRACLRECASRLATLLTQHGDETS